MYRDHNIFTPIMITTMKANTINYRPIKPKSSDTVRASFVQYPLQTLSLHNRHIQVNISLRSLPNTYMNPPTNRSLIANLRHNYLSSLRHRKVNRLTKLNRSGTTLCHPPQLYLMMISPPTPQARSEAQSHADSAETIESSSSVSIVTTSIRQAASTTDYHLLIDTSSVQSSGIPKRADAYARAF